MPKIMIILILVACVAWVVWTVRELKRALKDARFDEACGINGSASERRHLKSASSAP